MVWSDRSSEVEFRASGARLIGNQVVGSKGLASDRLPGMNQVQVAALDGRLGFELARPSPGRGQDVGPMLDHPQGTDGALDLGHEIVADRLRAPRPRPAARLLGVAL